MSLDSIEVIVENEKRKEVPMDISIYTHAIIIDLDISIYGQPSLELLHSKYPNIRVPRFGISNLQGTSSVGISKYPGPRSELFKYRISGYLSCRSCANLFKGHGFAKNPGSQTCKRRYGFTVPLLNSISVLIYIFTFVFIPNKLFSYLFTYLFSKLSPKSAFICKDMKKKHHAECHYYYSLLHSS